MRRRGVHDIKTHSTLAREGKLIGVARDWHKIRNGAGDNSSPESSDWSIGKHVYNKGSTKVRRSRAMSFYSDLYLDEKIKKYQMQLIQDQLQEMNQAMAEGILVSVSELERLKVRLSQLKTE